MFRSWGDQYKQRCPDGQLLFLLFQGDAESFPSKLRNEIPAACLVSGLGPRQCRTCLKHLTQEASWSDPQTTGLGSFQINQDSWVLTFWLFKHLNLKLTPDWIFSSKTRLSHHTPLWRTRQNPKKIHGDSLELKSVHTRHYTTHTHDFDISPESSDSHWIATGFSNYSSFLYPIFPPLTHKLDTWHLHQFPIRAEPRDFGEGWRGAVRGVKSCRVRQSRYILVLVWLLLCCCWTYDLAVFVIFSCSCVCLCSAIFTSNYPHSGFTDPFLCSTRSTTRKQIWDKA